MDIQLNKYWDNNLNGKPFSEAKDKEKAWWKCPNHEERYIKLVSSQKRKFGCIYCDGNSVLTGFNDLETLYPEVAELWDYQNNTIKPSEVKASTHKSYFFVCPKEGHSFDQRVAYFIESGLSCPYCSGKRVLQGFNDLATIFPDIAQEVDIENTPYLPTEITSKSNKKIPFICKKGHRYINTPSDRARQPIGCPYCAGIKAISGETDIFSVYPEYEKYWDYEKNQLDIHTVTKSSSIKRWWICDYGHSYDMSPNTKFGGKSIQGCPICSGHRVQKGFNDLAITHPALCSEWDYDNNSKEPSEYSRGSRSKVWWKCVKGHSYKMSIKSRTRPRKGNKRPSGCPICNANASRKEIEVFEYIKSILPKAVEVFRNDKTLITPLELDIYIPSKNIAIEFNGLYWHTENQGKDRNYHKEKHDACRRKNIQLITIWEDEWDFKREIVKSMIAHKIGVDNSDKVYARKAYVVEINKDSAREFLDKNHIQGFSSGTVYYGLEHDGSLVAVSSWRKLKNTLYLDRYATSCTVVGGMGKLLKQAKQYAKEKSMNEIVTFADKSVSDGSLYELLGFRYDGEIRPDYKYVVNGERKHKFGYRLKRFRNDTNLFYEDGLTEKQLADRNGLKRIWDCGKIRYTMKIE